MSLTVIGLINGSGSYNTTQEYADKVSREDETNATINNLRLERDRLHDQMLQTQPSENPEDWYSDQEDYARE